MLELYYSWYSICSEKVLICLFEKGLPFEGHHVDLFDFVQTEEAYLRINPRGTVPTLIVDGVPVYESTIINEYLDEAHPAIPLLPSEPMARARAREWIQLFQDLVFPAAGLLSQVHFIADEMRRRWSLEELDRMIARKMSKDRIPRQRRAVRGELTGEEIAQAERNIDFVLDRMEAALDDGRAWLVGEFSLADIAAAPNLYRFTIIDRHDFFERRPNCRRWFAAMSARPSFGMTYEYAPSVRT